MKKRRVKEGLTGHENAWHILVASRNDNHAVEVVSASSGLDLISDQVAGLEGVGHAACAHANTIADADGAKLVADDVSVFERGFYFLTETEEVLVTSTPRCEKEGWEDRRGARTGFLHTC